MKLALPLLLACSITATAADLRIGIIGCDTSHVTAFTGNLNDPKAKDHVPGGKVVAAYRGGSPDIPESAKRLDGYVKTLTGKYGVKMYSSIEELCKNVDAVLLESLDGRPKLEQLKPVLAAKKPVFLDKPMSSSLRDVMQMFEMAAEAKVPIFSSSGLRFSSNTVAVQNGLIGTVTNAATWGPCELEPHHPDLFWYGIHGTEALFTVMGPGCISVQRTNTPEGKIQVIGTWDGNRKGTYTEQAYDKGGFRGSARGTNGEAPIGAFDGYVPLVKQVMKFFQTGVAPVSPKETIQIFAFMEGADLSKSRGGAPVTIKEVIAGTQR